MPLSIRKPMGTYTTTMNAARVTPSRMGRWKTATTSTPNSAAAIPALCAALFQLGGLSRRSCLRRREISFDSSRVRACPVRERCSIVPACVPLCLRRRLRFVWATVCPTLPDSPQRVLDQVPLRREAAHRHVLREALEGRLGRESHELRLGHVGLRTNGL